MRFLRDRTVTGATAAVLLCFEASSAPAQTFVLDPLSTSLTTVPATSSDLLIPSTTPPAAPSPVVGLTAVELGLLPGDVIDAFSYADDAAPLGPATIYFSVDRASAGPGVVAAPDVTGENVTFPGVTQPEAASDIFSTNDPVCTALGTHSQVLDGNGALIGPPSGCGYGGGAPYGLGLTEALAAPPPPFSDNIDAFDWGVPGRGRRNCLLISLAPGSPTLVPGGNPELPAGAEPAEILLSCPGIDIAQSPEIFSFLTAADLGLVSGGPGCAPPLCDDIDALSGNWNFSLSPASPSVTGAPFFSAADILESGPALVHPAAALGLVPSDNVDALESWVNPCPGPLAGDGLDFDGVMPGPGCDNCPTVFNPGQEDTDNDTVGDVCDPCSDTDADGFGDAGYPASVCPIDLCAFTPGPNFDTDGDGWPDECDNCDLVANLDQADADGDATGDACDTCTDFDGDGFGEPGFPGNTCLDDNCLTTPNPSQVNSDADALGDDCDNCDFVDNDAQGNADGDSRGDECDACPHVFNLLPNHPFTSLGKVALGYDSTGPGGGDDRVKVTNAVLTTYGGADFDTFDNLHIKMTDSATGETLYAASLTAASGFWTQAANFSPLWKYSDPGPPFVKARVKESPVDSGVYKLKLSVKDTDVDGPLTPASGDITTTVEVTTLDYCLSITLPTCSNKATSDQCRP